MSGCADAMPVCTSRLPHFLKAAPARAPLPVLPRWCPAAFPRGPPQRPGYTGAWITALPGPLLTAFGPLLSHHAGAQGGPGSGCRVPRVGGGRPGRAGPPPGSPAALRSAARRHPGSSAHRLAKSEQTAIYSFFLPFFSLGSNRNRVSHRAEL